MNRLLEIELVPRTTWYNNVRSRVSRDKWNAIRVHFKKPSCQFCGRRYGLHCHEVWKYDDVGHIQKLSGFETACFLCHSIKHLGLAGLMAKRGDLDYRRLVEHYCACNGCAREDFIQDREEAFKLWEERSKFEWTVDISYLDSLNIVRVRDWMKEHPNEVQHVNNSYSDVLS